MRRRQSDWPFWGWPELNGAIQALMFFIITGLLSFIAFIVASGLTRMSDGLSFWR